jgi:Arc/MetJ-type ribon-helix-helix transcriptional regulator
MERCRITFEIEPEDRHRIEAVIKEEYPKLKNVSEVIRAALDQFLKTS